MPASRSEATVAPNSRFESLRPSSPEDQPVVDVLGRFRAERLGQLSMKRLVRPVVVPADHVRDPEVDVVDHAREVIRRGPVLAEERDPPESVAARARRPPRDSAPDARSAGSGPRPTRCRATRGRAGSPPRRRARCAPGPCRRSAAGSGRRSCGWRPRSGRSRRGASPSGSVRSALSS